MIPKKVFFCLLLICLSTVFVYSQDYGLQFYSHEEQLGSRTELVLNKGKDLLLKENFKLEFDLAFAQDHLSYFGYILRIIANDEFNIDLVYEYNINSLSVIEGQSAKVLSIPLVVDQLNEWERVSIELDKRQKQIRFSILDSTYFIETDLFSNVKKWKFYFGINNNQTFKTTDAPPMKLRDIVLFEQGKLKHRWKLNKKTGTVVVDELGNADALVENPLWLYTLHENWVLEKKLTFTSNAQFAQKGNSDSIFFLTSDSLYCLSLRNLLMLESQKLKTPVNLERGGQIICSNDYLAYYSVNQKILVKLSLNTLTSDVDIPRGDLTEFWHHNKFYNSEENLLYVIGGYGQLTYKNCIQVVDLNTGEWSMSDCNKDSFSPRYLASLGANNAGDTLYVCGGFGSSSGDQKLNPEYANDLVRIIPNENKIEKVYTIDKAQIEHLCLSNSMIVDDENRLFFALAYSKYEYYNQLHLIKGDLDKPEITVDSKAIDFTFHDIMSYVDLVYSPLQKKLFAFTVFHNEHGFSEVEIHSIYFPPNVDIDLPEKVKPIEVDNAWLVNLIIVFFVLTTIGIIWAIVTKIEKKRRNVQAEQKQQEGSAEPAVELPSGIDSVPQEVDVWFDENDFFRSKDYSIRLFGGFNIKDKEQNNITNKFTPLLKELFLLIYLHSEGEHGTGISPAKLKEILWYDKSEKQASNNRAVNIARLRSLLSKLGEISISKSTGYWRVVNGDNNIAIDYKGFLDIIGKNKLEKKDVIELIQITKNGKFLQNLSFEWLDSFKSEISNAIIDKLIEYLDLNLAKCLPSFIIKITDAIFLFDPVDDDALSYQCKTLAKLGKHSPAKNTYDRFTKEYKILYGEDYNKSFNEILEN